MNDQKRRSGISPLGDVSWGIHFCQFYQTQQDLLDVLIPYFRAGLENNECCIWITSEPLTSQTAKAEMAKQVPHFENYLKKGQIQIISHTDWYLKNNNFNAKRVLADWKNKLDSALKDGYDGLRVTGNTFWLEEKDWEKFIEYEEDINNTIDNCKIIVLCAYSLDKCSGSKFSDVIRNHEHALIKRNNEWIVVQSSKLKRTEEALLQSEQKFHKLFDSMTGGVALLQINRDNKNKISDYTVLDINRAYENIIGIKRIDRVGNKLSSFCNNPVCLSNINKVVTTGQPISFEIYLDNLEKVLHVSILPIEKDKLAYILSDITDRKNIEKEINHLASFPRLNIMPIVELNTQVEVVYANPAALALFPNLKKIGLKHPLLEGIDFDSIKSLNHHCREVCVDQKWYKQEINYIPEMDSVRVYNYDITVTKETEERQRIFLSILGHELRNPLSSILLMLEMLEQKEFRDSDIKETFGKLKHQADNMSYLLKDLLDISRIERNTIEIKKKEIDITKTIRDAADSVKLKLKNNNQYLELVIPNSKIIIEADPLRIEQVLVNLLTNASKYSSPNSFIRVSLEENNDQVVIKVKDNGIGISTDSLPIIFDLFAQENNIINQNSGGLGIGLYLSKLLVRLHGGDINAYCKGLGCGSEFIINLPLVKKTIVTKHEQKQKNIKKSPDKLKVLIIDDNIALLETFGEVVNMLGYETKTSNDGKKSLKIIKDFKPHICLIDLGMPGMDGLTVAKKIKANKEFIQPTLIAITGYGQEADKKSAKEAGFDDYVVKPIGIKELSKILINNSQKHF